MKRSLVLAFLLFAVTFTSCKGDMATISSGIQSVGKCCKCIAVSFEQNGNNETAEVEENDPVLQLLHTYWDNKMMIW